MTRAGVNPTLPDADAEARSESTTHHSPSPVSDLNHTHRPPTTREKSSLRTQFSEHEAGRPIDELHIHTSNFTALKRLMALPRTRRLPRGLFRRRVPQRGSTHGRTRSIPCALGQTGRLRRFRVPSACSAAGISWPVALPSEDSSRGSFCVDVDGRGGYKAKTAHGTEWVLYCVRTGATRYCRQ